MSRKKELSDTLRIAIDALDRMPEELAERFYCDLKCHRAHSLEDLQDVVASFPSWIVWKDSGFPKSKDCDWLVGKLDGRVEVTIFHDHVLGAKPEARPVDLSLLRKDADECRKQ